MLGHFDDAAEVLRAALDKQNEIGDMAGLARTTAALGDLLVARERPVEAIAAIADSIVLNREKGSPIGLTYNRRALADLRASLEGHAEAELQRAERALAEAEASLA